MNLCIVMVVNVGLDEGCSWEELSDGSVSTSVSVFDDRVGTWKV